MLSKKMIQACKYIDETIFYGDALFEDKDLAELEVYLSRWVRETTKIREVLASQAND